MCCAYFKRKSIWSQQLDRKVEEEKNRGERMFQEEVEKQRAEGEKEFRRQVILLSLYLYLYLLVI